MIALIAEKPSVAKDIARIIGATGRNDGYLSGNGYMVTWAFGLFHRPGARKVASELPVLRGVDLTVEKGDVVAILGPSGSGKTTLLRCLNFLETADAGQLVFDGESFDLAHASRTDIARLRKKTAFVFQNYNLFRNKTALQNVTEGLIVARKLPKEQADTRYIILSFIGIHSFGFL